MIAGRTLALQPYVMADAAVAWVCGEGAAPSGGAAMDDGPDDRRDHGPRASLPAVRLPAVAESLRAERM